MQKLSTLAPGDWVTANARQRPHQPCLVTPDGHVNYAEVNRQVTRLASGLSQLGLTKGDRITVLSTDSAEYVQLILASMKLGTTIVPLNFRLSSQEISNVIRAAAPTLHVVSERYADSLAAAGGVVPGLKATAMLGADRRSADISVNDIAGLAAGEEETPSSTGEEDTLFVMLTSGTTGTPKMVMQSQRMVRAVAFSGVYEQRLRAGDFMYSGAPLFHVAGLGHVMYSLACRGSSLILPQWNAADALHWLADGGLSHCMMVPSMALALLDEPGVSDRETRSCARSCSVAHRCRLSSSSGWPRCSAATFTTPSAPPRWAGRRYSTRTITSSRSVARSTCSAPSAGQSWALIFASEATTAPRSSQETSARSGHVASRCSADT